MAIAATFPGVRPVARPISRPVPSSVSRPVPATGLRLTARGRVALVLVSTSFLLLVVLFSGRLTADAGASTLGQGPATATVVVQAGESLWQIARQVAPLADPRETVLAIRELNGLGDSTVVAGQSIIVPRG